MFKPNGTPANHVDPLLLIHLWSHHLAQSENENSKRKMIFAGIGKPSYFLNDDIICKAATYWTTYRNVISAIKQSIADNKNLSYQEQIDAIVNAGAAIDYGLPTGEPEPKTLMAHALTNWYKTEIKPDDIIFTVGGWIALQMLFRILNIKNPQGRIVTPYPFYTFYNNPSHKNNLHFIKVMHEPGYRLTADALEKSINEANVLAQKDGNNISAFLFCDPNNPLGTVVNPEEWKKIAQVLKTTPSHIPIIIDEAYAEMTFNGKHISLLQVASDLKERIIILRSATKSLSASGERMAVIACFNQDFKDAITEEILLSYLHLPKSLQYAYAHALANFSDEKRTALTQFYQAQSQFVQKRLKAMNAHLPDSNYQVESTFYVIANLSDLIGTEISAGAELALGKKGLINTDVDICYSLLFQERVMVSALSFFGLDPKLGYVRITCSNGFAQLTEMLDRIENRLTQARVMKNQNSFKTLETSQQF